MRISPLGLLLIAMVGCGSGTEPAKTPAQLALGDPVANSVGMKFKLLPDGTFTMGEGNEVRSVTFETPFELGIYEVTQEQYQRVMGSNPSKFKVPQNPVEQVSWYEAEQFCKNLSGLPAEKGYVYRLPTEAEWEYACRAGTQTKYSFGDSESELGDYAWYDKNASSKTHPVGRKKPNAWGLYDMHGNVWEWCQDWYVDRSRESPLQISQNSGFKMFRGGGWGYYAWSCRSARRLRYGPGHRFSSIGFRVLRSSVK
jgi:formylglycine-generating enzyme required for sulfatase activity